MYQNFASGRMMKNLEEKTVQSHLVFQGRILTVKNDEVRLPDGSLSRRELVRHPGGAAVLFVKDGRVPLVQQYRYAYGEALWEIPAGKLDSPSENPAACAARELEEEIGYRANSLTALGVVYPSPGYTDELLSLYLCEEADFTEIHPDEGEFLRVSWFSLEELYRKIEQNKLRDAKTIIACLRYQSSRLNGIR